MIATLEGVQESGVVLEPLKVSRIVLKVLFDGRKMKMEPLSTSRMVMIVSAVVSAPGSAPCGVWAMETVVQICP